MAPRGQVEWEAFLSGLVKKREGGMESCFYSLHRWGLVVDPTRRQFVPLGGWSTSDLSLTFTKSLGSPGSSPCTAGPREVRPCLVCFVGEVCG